MYDRPQACDRPHAPSCIDDSVDLIWESSFRHRKDTIPMQGLFVNRYLLSAALLLVFGSLASGHIRIAPTESTAGAREKYTMRVPNEKQVPCSKIEGEFPAGLDIYDFEFKPGWKIDFKKNDKGKIIGATWTGKMMPYEFVEFGMLGINPKEATDLVWKFVQYYDDGTKEEFTGPVGSRLPSPVVTLKAAQAK